MAGIFQVPSGVYRAMLDFRRKRHYLGVFSTRLEAEQALDTASALAKSGPYPPDKLIGPATAFDTFKERFRHDPESGLIFYRRRPQGCRSDVAGSLTDRGYINIPMLGQNYRAHRVMWLLMTGEWPKGHIDHINGDRADNRFCNLRVASPGENQCNKRKNRTSASPYKGVWRGARRNRWQAKITIQGKQTHLGCFATAEEAHDAYAAAARKHFGGFARLG